MSKPAILVIHNLYRNKGGEDTVVMHEIEALKRAGAQVFELYFQNPHNNNSSSRLLRFFSGIYFNIWAYWRVYRLVRKQKVKVVHVHNVFYQASPSVLWAAHHAGARVVATLHNYRLFCLNALFFRSGQQCTLCVDEKSFKPGVLHACFRNSRIYSFFLASSLNMHRRLGSWIKCVDQFIIVNPAMRIFLEGIKVAPNRIYLKPNCIEGQSYSSYQHRKSHYLFAGRLEPEKGLADILEEWKQIEAPLYIAGDGSMREQVRAMANEQITYLGFLSAEEVRKEMNSCKALLFGSKLMEGMPLSIIEALASGAVCVAYNTAVTRLLIEDGKTGWLFGNHPGEKSFSEVISIVERMNHEQLRKMSEAARISYESRFSMREHIRHVAKVYRLKFELPVAEGLLSELNEAQAVAV